MSKTVIVTKYLGVPYKNRGRDTNGLDCWGLVLCVYKDIFGIDLPDLENYEVDWSYKGNNYIMERYTNEWVRVEKPQELDVVLMKNGRGITNHAGIMLDSINFIQCSKAGVTIAKITDKRIDRRIEGFFRYDKSKL
jgi:cell wall-associated NlpC family hydrolase